MEDLKVFIDVKNAASKRIFLQMTAENALSVTCIAGILHSFLSQHQEPEKNLFSSVTYYPCCLTTYSQGFFLLVKFILKHFKDPFSFLKENMEDIV